MMTSSAETRTKTDSLANKTVQKSGSILGFKKIAAKVFSRQSNQLQLSFQLLHLYGKKMGSYDAADRRQTWRIPALLSLQQREVGEHTL